MLQEIGRAFCKLIAKGECCMQAVDTAIVESQTLRQRCFTSHGLSATRFLSAMVHSVGNALLLTEPPFNQSDADDRSLC